MVERSVLLHDRIYTYIAGICRVAKRHYQYGECRTAVTNVGVAGERFERKDHFMYAATHALSTDIICSFQASHKSIQTARVLLTTSPAAIYATQHHLHMCIISAMNL